MPAFSPGDIVIVPFPVTDLLAVRRRASCGGRRGCDYRAVRSALENPSTSPAMSAATPLDQVSVPENSA